LGKGTGLVRANARGRSKGLNRLEVLDKDEFTSHSLSSKGKRYSDSSKETLWYVGDNDTNGENNVGDKFISVKDTTDEESNTKSDGDS
jgi:hypothetical protein